jgi:hypothetical protein
VIHGFQPHTLTDRRASVPFWRKVDRLRPLDEAAAYARCHGDRDDSVRVVTLPPRRARYDLLATGEEIRRRLEERIDARDTDPTLAPSATPTI